MRDPIRAEETPRRLKVLGMFDDVLVSIRPLTRRSSNFVDLEHSSQ
jgi:hypothetical protein